MALHPRAWPALALILACMGCASTRYRGDVLLEEQAQPEPAAGTVSRGPSRGGVRPPDCAGDLPMPVYPAALLTRERPTVRVRVDIHFDREGMPEEVTGRFLDEEGPGVAGPEEAAAGGGAAPPAAARRGADPAAAGESGGGAVGSGDDRGAAGRGPEETGERSPGFLRAAEDAVRQWRCRPAWRPPRDGEPPRWVTLPYDTWVIFRFDAERVDGTAALEARKKDGGERS